MNWKIAAPLIFVFLWSSGFPAAKFSMPYAPPFHFLSLRAALTLLAMGLILIWLHRSGRARWQFRWAEVRHDIVVGVLLHGIYLGFYFWAVRRGAHVGLSAVIIGLQPLLTTALAVAFLGERLRPMQWLGFALGFLGVAGVIIGKYGLGVTNDAHSLLNVALVVVALIGSAFALFYQKKFSRKRNLLLGAWMQYLAALIFFLLMSTLLAEERAIQWNPTFAAALAWQVLALSTGSIWLLMTLIERGAASHVASLFYLVPPCVLVMTYLMFGESLPIQSLLSAGVVALGVFLVLKKA